MLSRRHSSLLVDACVSIKVESVQFSYDFQANLVHVGLCYSIESRNVIVNIITGRQFAAFNIVLIRLFKLSL